MRITILYDNESAHPDLPGDWGFACLIEHQQRRLLFDTGAKGDLLLNNMKKLGVDPTSINEVFISHDHWDHTGGLEAFLKLNSKVTVYLPSGMKKIGSAAKYDDNPQPADLGDGFHSTGLLANIEQALLVELDRGLAVIAGCSHPGVGAILKAAADVGTPFALIGGLHGFDEFDLIEHLDLVCATHCTEHIAEIKSRYPDTYLEGGAGRVIEL